MYQENFKEPPSLSIEELLNDIYKDPAESLLEKIISWCDENNYDAKEIGYILGESEYFKRKLHISCVENNQMRDELLTKKMNSTKTMDIW